MHPGAGRAYEREKMMRGLKHFLAGARRLYLFIFQNIPSLFPPKSAPGRFALSSPSFAFSSFKCPVADSQPERSLAVKFIIHHLLPAHSGFQHSADVGNTEQGMMAHPDACCTQNPKSDGHGKCVTFTTDGFPACF